MQHANARDERNQPHLMTTSKTTTPPLLRWKLFVCTVLFLKLDDHLCHSFCLSSTSTSSTLESMLVSSSSSSSSSSTTTSTSTRLHLTTISTTSTSTDPLLPEIQKQYCVTGLSPPRATPLNEAVSMVANVTLEVANNLIDMGAVWARMDTLTEQDLLEQYSNDKSESLELYADLPKGWGAGGDYDLEDTTSDSLDDYVTKMQNQRFKRILTPSLMQPGTDLRIYPRPRRFPACYEMTPQRSLLHQDTTFLVVEKPPLLPTQPDASNYHENCPGCTQDLLGPFHDIHGNVIRRPLLCHRVDAVVGGCVVMAKDRNGQRVFQDFQRQRRVKKLYLAVTTQPVPLGVHLHWMWSPQSIRGTAGGPPCQLVSHVPPESRRKARQFWTRCILEVTKCERITLEPKTDHYEPPPNVQHYQSTIRLVTGRKHQVRAQLSSLGCPIILDTLYEPVAGLTLNDLETMGESSDGKEEEEEDDDAMEMAIAQCRVPTKPIGLQAHAILFGGIRAKAGVPWWGCDVQPDGDDDDDEEE